MSIDTLVSRSDFAGAFKAVKPHVVPKTDLVPVLRNIEIRFFEDHLTMVATNRYTLAEARVNYSGDNRVSDADVAPLSGTAILVDVEDLAYAVKRTSSVHTALSIQVKDAELVLDYTTTAPLDTDSSFPKMSHLWPAKENMAEQSSVMLNPAYLALFDSRNLARDKYEKSAGLRLSFFGKARPVLVEFAEHFRGIVMPIREASS